MARDALASLCPWRRPSRLSRHRHGEFFECRADRGIIARPRQRFDRPVSLGSLRRRAARHERLDPRRLDRDGGSGPRKSPRSNEARATLPNVGQALSARLLPGAATMWGTSPRTPGPLSRFLRRFVTCVLPRHGRDVCISTGSESLPHEARRLRRDRGHRHCWMQRRAAPPSGSLRPWRRATGRDHSVAQT